FVAIVWGLGELVEQLQLPKVLTGTICATTLTILAAMTWIQLRYWQNSVQLWEHTLAVTENNSYAHEQISMCYRRMGWIAEADKHSAEAARIQRQRRQHSRRARS